MSTLSLILFAITIAIGVILAFLATGNRPPSRVLKMAHAIFALAGLVLVVILSVQGFYSLWVPAVLSLVVIALGVMGSIKRVRGTPSDLMIGVHSIVAVLWYICLVCFVLIPAV